MKPEKKLQKTIKIADVLNRVKRFKKERDKGKQR
jgi:hypothetical protein